MNISNLRAIWKYEIAHDDTCLSFDEWCEGFRKSKEVENGVVIEIKNRSAYVYVCVKDMKGISAIGEDKTYAIGNLIIAYPELFNITLET